MKTLDMFLAHPNVQTEVILPDYPVHGTSFSPHTVSLRERKPPLSTALTKQISTFDRVQQSGSPLSQLSRPAPRSKARIFSRELRLMACIGLSFFSLLWGSITAHQALSFVSEAKQLKNKVMIEVQDAENALNTRDLSGLHSLLDSWQQKIKILTHTLQNPLLASPAAPSFFQTHTQAAALLSAAFSEAAEIANIFQENRVFFETRIAKALSGEINLLRAAEDLFPVMSQIADHLVTLESTLVNINTLPKVVQEKIQSMLPLLQKITAFAKKKDSYIAGINTLLGQDHLHTYAIFTQNTNEIRPSGGFLGGVFIAHVFRGEIVSWKFHDIYEFDGQMGCRFAAPSEFAHLTDCLYLRDANTFPDFQKTAEQLKQFLEYEKGITADTIIGVNQTVLEDILNIIGPIALFPEKNISVTEQSAAFTLSYLIESKVFQSEKNTSPKSILNSLAFSLLEEIQQHDITQFFPLLQSWQQEKDIQIYSRDTDLQSIWQELHIDGAFFPEEPEVEFMGVVHSSVGANKSDAFIHQHIEQNTFLNLQGELHHQVQITRSHQWGEPQERLFENLFQTFGSGNMGKEDLKKILGKADNKVFTTVYFPRGTALHSSKEVSPSEVQTQHTEHFTAFSFFFPPIAAQSSKQIVLTVESPHVWSKDASELAVVALAQPAIHHTRFSFAFVPELGMERNRKEYVFSEFRSDIQIMLE